MKRILTGIAATAALIGIAPTAFARTAYPDGVVNIRSGPGTTYSIIGTLRDGEKATILSHDGSWLKVRTAGGLVGYMADWVTYEAFDDEVRYVEVDTDVLSLRQGPAQGSAVLGNLYQGQRFRLLQGYGDWYQIDAGQLGTGWVSKQYVYPASAPPATQPPNTPPPEQPPVQLGLAKAVSAANSTIIYNGRSADYDSLANVKAGEMLTYLDMAEGWIKVANKSGVKGWVSGDYLYLWDEDIDFSYQASYGVSENNWVIRYLKVRQVVDGGGPLALRSAGSKDAPVMRTLASGERMKLLYVGTGEYVQVMLSDGTVGWLSRNWIKPVDGIPAESVRVSQVQAGAQRLEVTGSLAVAAVTATATGLTVSLPENANRKAALHIGQYDLGALKLDASSLQLQVDQPFWYEVIEKSDSRLVIEIRPTVTKVEEITGVDRVTYRFTTVGNLLPEVHREGTDILLSLPGARLSSGTAVPDGLSVTGSAAGLTARLTSSRPYAIKRGHGYLDLVVYSAGLAGKTIVLDPGHGGSELGATGAAGLVEKEANLAIALKLQKLLTEAGAKVLMTRTADTRCARPEDLAQVPPDEQLHFDLNCRSVVANAGGADAFISIHNNANPNRSLQGTEVYWSRGNLNAAQSQAMASLFQRELVNTLGRPDLKVKDQIFYVVTYTDAPAVLAEVAFVSNPSEEALLKQDAFRQRAAEAMFRAIQQFFQ